MKCWWFLDQLGIDSMINSKLWNLISQFHTIQYPKGQISINSLRTVQFKNVNHHYNWENVYLNNIPKPQFWGVQKSLILSEWITYRLFAVVKLILSYGQKYEPRSTFLSFLVYSSWIFTILNTILANTFFNKYVEKKEVLSNICFLICP